MIELPEMALVRHGSYDRGTGHLNDVGRRQAALAATSLFSRHKFLDGLILTSSAARAVETAERISLELGGEIIPSHILHRAGEYPQAMKNLRTLTREVINRAMPELDYDRPLVVVSHLPLMAAMMEVEEVENGEVYFYHGDGRSPVYDPTFEGVLGD